MATEWQIGDRIQNRWEIHEISQGGMGRVYVVFDHETGEAFAAKTFRDDVFARNPGIADRFRKEAATWINLDAHENVTRAHRVYDIEGKPFLFLEYASGSDLSKWIEILHQDENRPQALRFAIQFCDGMTHVLSRGIEAHRDIKPQNCLLTQDAIAKVTDFGLAKVFDDATTYADEPDLRKLRVNHTRTGMAAGTPTHMAPEQFDDLKRVGVRADIYSFGVMLFQMITGRLPFAGRSWDELKQMHKNQQPQVSDINLPALRAVVESCLVKQPEGRFADFVEVRKALARIYESETGKLAPRPAAGAQLDAADWSNKGTNLKTLGHHEKALVCFDRALAINDRSEQAWVNKGSTLGEMGRHREELECAERALKLNPRFETAWSNKGVALWSLGRNQESLDCIEHALEINPRYAEAWSNKGSALNAVGRNTEALACYDHSLTLDPYLDHAWHCKAAVLRELNRHQEAIECCDRAIDINPRAEKAWINKIASLGTLGRLMEAHECCGDLLKIKPRSEKAWTYKGNVFEAWGQVTQALECYDRAIEINPGYGEAWHNKGVTLANSGRLSEALACFEKAMELGHRPAAQAIARCRQMLGL